MNFKAIAVAALVAGLSVSGAANATNTVLGPASVGVPLTFGGLAGVGPFQDTFEFSLPANGGSGYSVANFTLLPGVYNTILNTLTVVSNPDGIMFNGDDVSLGTSIVPGVNSLNLSLAPSAAGNYYLLVQGLANGTQGGIYTGAISVAAPVPEPETYAMMLAGLVAVGFLARRRA